MTVVPPAFEPLLGENDKIVGAVTEVSAAPVILTVNVAEPVKPPLSVVIVKVS